MEEIAYKATEMFCTSLKHVNFCCKSGLVSMDVYWERHTFGVSLKWQSPAVLENFHIQYSINLQVYTFGMSSHEAMFI